MKFSNTYINFDEAFFKKALPKNVRDPQLFLFNEELAELLMIPDELKNDAASIARYFSGNEIFPGAEPIATAYAGHQFGGFVPQLGDGRAHLLGEVIDREGKRHDIQLKGSGPTFFSRGGDGRCAIGPAVREFIMSEAMHALGVPTTRCLSVVTTGEPVFRETTSPGAVVTRVASSHIRIGTFQYFAARDNQEAIKALCEYTIERHYPDIDQAGDGKYVLLIEKFIEKQIHLIVEWMRIGFIHGVMNTDNTTLSGETIDYGPCAMMGAYHPQTVYSSIDKMGRYAFGNQSQVARWNIARFAECLLPLIHPEPSSAIEQAEPLINAFSDKFQEAYLEMMGKKLGLKSSQPEDRKLIDSMLALLQKKKMDYTITFHRLTNALKPESDTSDLENELEGWFDLWKNRLNESDTQSEERFKLMRQNNPVVIPRNHHMESVISECEAGGDTMAEEFLNVLRSPYKELEETSDYQDPPEDGDLGYKTFCGT